MSNRAASRPEVVAAVDLLSFGHWALTLCPAAWLATVYGEWGLTALVLGRLPRPHLDFAHSTDFLWQWSPLFWFAAFYGVVPWLILSAVLGFVRPNRSLGWRVLGYFLTFALAFALMATDPGGVFNRWAD